MVADPERMAAMMASLRHRLHLLAQIDAAAAADFALRANLEMPQVAVPWREVFPKTPNTRPKKEVTKFVIAPDPKPAPSIQTAPPSRTGMQRSGPRRKPKILAVRASRRRFNRDWRASSEVYRILNGVA